MLKTRIRIDNGGDLDVQESYQEVEFRIVSSLNTGTNLAIFTLENGEKVGFMVSNIVYFTKY